jgi:hypothetical protein
MSDAAMGRGPGLASTHLRGQRWAIAADGSVVPALVAWRSGVGRGPASLQRSLPGRWQHSRSARASSGWSLGARGDRDDAVMAAAELRNGAKIVL